MTTLTLSFLLVLWCPQCFLVPLFSREVRHFQKMTIHFSPEMDKMLKYVVFKVSDAGKDQLSVKFYSPLCFH